MERAIIYARTSGDDTETDSLSAQERVCERYAEAKGYEVVTTLKEDIRGVRGASFDAPELKRALELAKSSIYDVLIIRDISRFARDIEKFSFFEPRLRRFVRVEFVWQDFDNTPTGRFYKTVSVGIAQLEKDMITQRLQNGKRDKVENRQSMITANNVLFGFEIERINGAFKAKVVESEAAIIRMIFDLYVNEGMSTYKLAKYLKDNEIPTYSDIRGKGPANKKAEPYQWHISVIRQILTNTAYYGEWRYGKRRKIRETVATSEGDMGEVTHYVENPESHHLIVNVTPIVSKELWDTAQEKLQENRTNTHPKVDKNHLFSRRVYCSCGGIMHCESKTNTYKGESKVYFYYNCRNTDQRLVTGATCSTKRINAGLLDTVVWEWLENTLRDREGLSTRIENYKSEIAKQLEPLELSLSITESELKEAKKNYGKILKAWSQADSFDRAFLDSDKKILRDRLNALQSQFDKLSKEADTLRFSIKQVNTYFTILSDIERENSPIEALYWAEDQFEFWEEWKDLFDDNLDYFLLLKIWEDKDKLTIREKRQTIAKFNVKVYVSDDQQSVTAKCDLGSGFISLLTSTRPNRSQEGQKFILSFADVLILDFNQIKKPVEV